MRRELIRTSRFLSLVLRHDPARIGLTLDAEGWASVDDLLAGMQEAGHAVSRDGLDEIVATNDKGRFALSPDRARIRARQGHSLEVDLGLSPSEPPERLFHGTARRHVDGIRAGGLVRGSRQYVHLSPDEGTARRVGQRHGEPVVLSVEARRLAGTGVPFYRSENGIWLTERVPPEYIGFPDSTDPP